MQTSNRNHQTTLSKVRVGHELYVFRGTELIYKRWINTVLPDGSVRLGSYGRVFHENEGLTQFTAEGRKKANDKQKYTNGN